MLLLRSAILGVSSTGPTTISTKGQIDVRVEVNETCRGTPSGRPVTSRYGPKFDLSLKMLCH